MGESLLSLGLDVGTTTSQLILSRLRIENRAGAFSVPEMAVTERTICYRSPVRLTPLRSGELVDGEALRCWVEDEYEKAGISPEQVSTGAVIITGETSRKENAAAVLQALSGFAGEFVAATAGPHLESVLAAKGAGAVTLSENTDRPVLHMDIGGGTANLALIRKGNIERTGCLNVGGRLLRQEGGRITYVSEAVKALCDFSVGDPVQPEKLTALAERLTQALEMAAGLRPATKLLETLSTREAGSVWEVPKAECVISFSGGVADCIKRPVPTGQYGDIGPELGKAIRESRLCRGAHIFGKETIGATVIGAGCHSTRLSGSTVYHRDVVLPVKNLPVVSFSEGEQTDPELSGLIKDRLSQQDGAALLSFPGFSGGGYESITALAKRISEGVTDRAYICLEQDMAKALGQRLALLRPDMPILCIDRLKLHPGDYLDIGKPTGPALPVVIKTLILSAVPPDNAHVVR